MSISGSLSVEHPVQDHLSVHLSEIRHKRFDMYRNHIEKSLYIFQPVPLFWMYTKIESKVFIHNANVHMYAHCRQ